MNRVKSELIDSCFGSEARLARWFLVAALFAIMLIPSAAQAQGGSVQVTLSWTAPGDDGNIGTATTYELRYSLDSATLINNFESADAVPNVPLPKPAGELESFTFSDLPFGPTFFIAMVAVDEAGNRSEVSNVVRVVTLSLDIDDELEIPNNFSLSQNYPNPFNPSTTIEYSIPSATDVRLVVYNVRGQAVATLVNEFQSAGNHQVQWDGNSESGIKAASGVYFYRLETKDQVETKKMILVK